MIQTMQPISDSRVVAARVAMDQLEALGAECFDIGVKRVDGTIVLRERWGAKQVLKSLLWLRRENLNRGHIYVRPAGVHGLSLVDDLKPDTFVRMKMEGFAPAAVIETSPGNFQAWLKHGEVLDEATSTRAAKLLAERYGGDPGSADWRHFGRLAGFTNPKPSRRLASGLQPFARLLEASGQVYRQAPVFIAEIKAALAGEGAMVGGGDEGSAATVCDVKRYGIPFDFSLFDLIGLRGVCSRWRQEYRIGYRRYQNRLPWLANEEVRNYANLCRTGSRSCLLDYRCDIGIAN
jgi:RepB DNA-primase from phage plasmid